MPKNWLKKYNYMQKISTLNYLYQDFKKIPTNLEKNQFLFSLKNKNLSLFYKFAKKFLGEVLPIIYTPTVGEAVLHYRNILRHKNALYLRHSDRDNLDKILNKIHQDVAIIVVTDGERILGLGDQGASGVEIPVAKLMLYTLFAGIKEQNTLPIVLDVGTNNEDLLKNKQYFGWQHRRISKKQYDLFINKFVKAIKKRWPNVILQWEDFGRNNAMAILKKYRKVICSFNDDIQGTSVVTLATIMSALKITNSKFADQRVVIFGAGSAGLGIANMLTSVIKKELGCTEQHARKQFWLLDKNGLLTTNSKDFIAEQKPFLRDVNEVNKWHLSKQDFIDLFTVVKNVQPTILVGCSGVGKSFNEKIIEEMAKHVARPIILPLSNPTKKSEAEPIDLINWTDGRALIATGSPYPPVKFRNRTIPIAQCNNVFSFPGLGLGVIKSRAKIITDEMLMLAAETILKFHQNTFRKKKVEILLPNVTDAAKIAKKVSAAIVKDQMKTKKGSLN